MNLIQRGRGRGEHGFTLIELLVVLLILAAVAGIVVPAVAMVGRTTDMAASAANQNELSKNIQQYFLLQKRYPQGLDSLLQDTTGGALGTAGDGSPDGVFIPLGADTSTTPPTAITDPQGVNTNNQISGFPKSGPDLWACLEMVSISNANQVRSLTRAGFDYVFDHQTYDPATNAGERDSNVSAKYQRAITSGPIVVAAVRNPNVGTWTDLGTVSNPTIQNVTLTLLQQLVPGDFNGSTYTPELGTRIVAFGVGARSKLTPTTMTGAPTYPGSDKTYYGRYIAYFKIYDTGERAVFLGVSDSYGRLPDYTQRQFNESLPNGARQG